MVNKRERKVTGRRKRRTEGAQTKPSDSRRTAHGVLGCLILLLPAVLISRACAASLEEQESTTEEEALRTDQLLEGLRSELSAMDPLSNLFTPARCGVIGEIGHVYVRDVWYELPIDQRRDTIRLVTAAWGRVTGKPGSSWFLYDAGDHPLGGRSVFKGDYLEE